MPDERDGQHAGGSIVDTTRANMSPEQAKKDNETREKEQQDEPDRKEDKQ